MYVLTAEGRKAKRGPVRRPHSKPVIRAVPPMEGAERPRRAPRFNWALQRMCDEPGCVWPAEVPRADGSSHCRHHDKLKFGRLDKPLDEDTTLQEWSNRTWDNRSAEASGFQIV